MFSELELERFRLHDAHLQRLGSGKNHSIPNTHRRGYKFGDLRCTHCKKWLNPKKPEEAAEIRYGRRMNRLHYRCPIYSPYPAVLIMFPRFHGARRRNVDSAKRI